MRPMRLCFCLGKQLEKTFNDSQWTKIAWMQPLFSCSLNLEHEVFEVLNETFAPSIRNKVCYRRIKHQICFKACSKINIKIQKEKWAHQAHQTRTHHTTPIKCNRSNVLIERDKPYLRERGLNSFKPGTLWTFKTQGGRYAPKLSPFFLNSWREWLAKKWDYNQVLAIVFKLRPLFGASVTCFPRYKC